MTEQTGQIEDLLRAATVALTVPVPGAPDPEFGTGVLVAPGIIATCAHVLLPRRGQRALPATVDVRLPGATRDETVTVDAHWVRHEEDDLAFLPAPEAFTATPVLLGTAATVGDGLWTYGHPAGMFRAGQPATLTYQGTSVTVPAQRTAETAEPAPRQVERVYGVPVGGGVSGSAVLNRRTGAVIGMVSTSDEAGSAHLVPAAAILDALARVLGRRPAGDPAWLDALSDEQILGGGWRHPGPRLRAYLDALRAKATTVVHLSDPRRGAPPLMKAYVRQAVHTTGGATPAAIRRQAAADGYDPDPMATNESAPPERMSAEQMLARDGDLLVIGGPGAGKSTLLRAIAHDAAARLLAGTVEDWVPVRILASDLIERRSLAESVADGVRRDLGGLAPGEGLSTAFFAAAPLPGARWLILVDGVDEITHAAARREVLDTIATATRATAGSTHRFVVATRDLPADELAIDGWHPTRFEIEPFTPADLAEFAHAWFAATGHADPEAAGREFIAEVERVRLRDPARTPLMAAILCRLYAQSPDGKLPEHRPEVYREFVARSFDRLYDADFRAGLTGALRRYSPEVLAAADRVLAAAEGLLGRLAAARMDGDTTPAVTLLAGWCGEEPPEPARAAWTAFLEDLLRRNGLLAEQGGDFRFVHQTFAEYLSARHIVADAERSAARYRALFGTDTWIRVNNRANPRPGWQWWRPRRWQAPPTAEDSYHAFLISAWLAHPDHAERVRRALRRAATGGALHGCQFVVDLRDFGVALDPALRDTVVKALVRGGVRHAWRYEWRTSYGRYRRDLSATLVGLLGARSREPLETIAQRSTNADVRGAAARALIALDVERGAEPARGLELLETAALRGDVFLGGLVKTGDPDVLHELARAQHAQGNPAGMHMLALCLATGIVNGRVGEDFARTLIDAGDERGTDLLDMLAATGDESDRFRAAKTLADLDAVRGADALARLAATGESDVDRWNAAEELARLRDPRATDLLAQLTADRDAYVGRREAAAKTLANQGDERGEVYLLGLLHESIHLDSRSPHSVIKAADALATVGSNHAERILIAYAGDPQCSARAQAVKLLGRAVFASRARLRSEPATIEDELARLHQAKLAAVDELDFDRAAELREREKRLLRSAAEHRRVEPTAALADEPGHEDQPTTMLMRVIAGALSARTDSGDSRLRPDHLFLALLGESGSIAAQMMSAALDLDTGALADHFRAWRDTTDPGTDRSPAGGAAPEEQPSGRTVREAASEVLSLVAATMPPGRAPSTADLLLALHTDLGGDVSRYLNDCGLTRDTLVRLRERVRTGRTPRIAQAVRPVETPALDRFGRDFVRDPRDESGSDRKRLTARLARILAHPRRYVIFENDGSNEAARRAVEGLARSIAAGTARKPLATMPVISVDLDALRVGHTADMPSADALRFVTDLHRRGPSILHVEGLLEEPADPDPTAGVIIAAAMGDRELRLVTTATREQIRRVWPRNPLYRVFMRRFITVIRPPRP